MAGRVLLLILGLLNVLNGVFMLAAPGAWFAMVPGVAATGAFNAHFVYDVGMAYLASGIFLAYGFRGGRTAAIVAMTGAIWPVLHALIHIDGWLTMGFPRDSQVATSEVVGVVVLSFLGAVLAWMRLQRERA
ncbi:MAG: hypothetical protein JO261_00380 [Alphaproteobacteria bacterium]|nr:hypothetical protein [Alphaproteobacteria bacterium]MBV9692130.1 hypothetical protein [Alphaproteobacteria bacterium]